MKLFSINGQLGSGKSAVCDFLKKKYGFLLFSTGMLHRQLAKERGVTSVQFNEIIKNDPSVDEMIDKACIGFYEENKGKNIVFDSRLAWHFVKETFKIFLVVAPSIAADRVFKSRIIEEHYHTKEDALTELTYRRKLENERFIKTYDVDCNDYKNYDIIIDTSSLEVEHVAQFIIAAYDKSIKSMEYDRVLCSPGNLYPTKKITALDMNRVALYAEKFKHNEEIESILLLRYQNDLFIYDGHHRVMAANKIHKPIIAGRIEFQEHDKMPSGIFPEQYISLSLSNLRDWEDACGLIFGYYPSVCHGQKCLSVTIT